MRIKDSYHSFLTGIVLLIPSLTSCINDDLISCQPLGAAIKVVVADIPGIDPVNGDDIEHIRLYVFDKDDRFVAETQGKLNETIQLLYPKAATPFHVIAIGNAHAGQSLTALKEGDCSTSGTISLLRGSAFKGFPVYTLPDDLFRGEIITAPSKEEVVERNKTYDLPIRRIVSGISIKISGLQQYVQTEDTDFSIIIRSPYHRIGFDGSPQASTRAEEAGAGEEEEISVHWVRTGTFDPVNKDYEAPLSRILSSAEGEEVQIGIYHAQEHIHSVTADNQGQQLKAINGKRLEVFIDFSGDVEVSITQSPWDKDTVGKEF
jgi:hypothetical protein